MCAARSMATQFLPFSFCALTLPLAWLRGAEASVLAVGRSLSSQHPREMPPDNETLVSAAAASRMDLSGSAVGNVVPTKRIWDSTQAYADEKAEFAEIEEDMDNEEYVEAANVMEEDKENIAAEVPFNSSSSTADATGVGSDIEATLEKAAGTPYTNQDLEKSVDDTVRKLEHAAQDVADTAKEMESVAKEYAQEGEDALNQTFSGPDAMNQTFGAPDAENVTDDSAAKL